jgi:hypothetical protein
MVVVVDLSLAPGTREDLNFSFGLATKSIADVLADLDDAFKAVRAISWATAGQKCDAPPSFCSCDNMLKHKFPSLQERSESRACPTMAEDQRIGRDSTESSASSCIPTG